MSSAHDPNIDRATVRGFGQEWSRFDQSNLPSEEASDLFGRYFSLIPIEEIGRSGQVMDVGCGSGRWAKLVAPHVGRLVLVDASQEALDVARKNLDGLNNCEFHCRSVADLPVEDYSMDLVYSLGVLHHVPDTQEALKSCASKVKPGGSLLVYLYYRFDDRPRWFRTLWKLTDLVRRGLCRSPNIFKRIVTDVIAFTVYLPLARLAACGARKGRNTSTWPLSYYRNASLYTMRTDALDRFGTRLEQRFTKSEIKEMMEATGLVDVRFRETEPFWCVMAKQPNAIPKI